MVQQINQNQNNQNQQIIESNNWSAVSQGTTSEMKVVNGQRQQMSKPTNMGIFAIATNLAYLARQLPTLNKHAKNLRPVKKDGSFYINLGSITVKPDGQNSMGRKRLARFGFDLGMMPNVTRVVVSADIPEFTRKQIETAYSRVYRNGMSGQEFLQALRDVPVLATGNYSAANEALNPMVRAKEGENKISLFARAQYATIFLRYVDLNIATTSAGFITRLKPFQFGPVPAQNSETKLSTVNLGLPDNVQQDSSNKVVKVMRMSDFGNSDGTISGMNTLGYFKNFNSFKSGVTNIRTFKVSETDPQTGQATDQSFTNVVLGSLDWNKMNTYQKILFPDNVISLFNHFGVQRVSFRYTFSATDYVNGMPRKGSFLDHIQKYDFKPVNNGLWAFNGSISLENKISDYDPVTLENNGKKHITLYKTSNGQVNAEIIVQRPTFVQMQKTVSESLTRRSNSGMSRNNWNSLSESAPERNNGIQIASPDLQSGN